jgi:serine acetyltransferase
MTSWTPVVLVQRLPSYHDGGRLEYYRHCLESRTIAYNLNHFYAMRIWLLRWRARWLRYAVGMDVDTTLQSSLSSRFLPARRGSIAIGSETLVAFKTLIYTRDPITGNDRPVRIGSRCFIGGGSMILPGVTIGNECIIGAGAVVFEDVPSRSIAAGNPARIVRTNIRVGAYGHLKDLGNA